MKQLDFLSGIIKDELKGKKTYQSKSGSEYFSLPNGIRIRISDHELPDVEFRKMKSLGKVGSWNVTYILGGEKSGWSFEKLREDFLWEVLDAVSLKVIHAKAQGSISGYTYSEWKEDADKIESIIKKEVTPLEATPKANHNSESTPQSEIDSDDSAPNVQNPSDNSKLESELKSIIESELATACQDNLPAICRMASTPAGKETIANMIFQYCANNGCSPQTAMAFLESELPPQ